MGSLWNRSGTIERYGDDLRAAGAKAYFFAGGTTTPMSVFQDAGEGSAHPHPVVADADGRWPDVFVPYTLSYDVRVTTADGVQLTYSLQIPNPDPVDVTVTVDPANVIQTGMVHAEFVNTTKTGYVRCNGRTLGNASSGATERANADTSALFIYLWNNLIDGICPVSGGRGGTGAADYAANKTITLPDLRGSALIGLDDMGNSSLDQMVQNTFIQGSHLVAGSWGGRNIQTISIAQLPAHTHTATAAVGGGHDHGGATGSQSVAHTHTGTVDAGGGVTPTASAASAGGHTHTVNVSNNTLGGVTPAPTSGSAVVTTSYATSSDGAHTHAITVDPIASHTHTFTTSGISSTAHTHGIAVESPHTHAITVDNTGSGTVLETMPLSRLVTWFIKL